MAVAPDLFEIIDRYIDDLFVREDEALVDAVRSARAGGLPEIQVSKGQGKLLYLLARMIGAGEVGFIFVYGPTADVRSP